MDMPWGSDPSRKFITNVGLITSNGPHDNNVMAAEWTHHISYEPGLIAVNVHTYDATHDNIMKTKEFGVNIAATDQNIDSSIAGGSSGKNVDKIAVLRELGIEFYKAKKINVLMIKGAALNMECRVIETKMMGDHMMFIGEVVEVTTGDKEPLLYYGGKYYKVGDNLKKPDQKTIEKIQKLVEKYKKK